MVNVEKKETVVILEKNNSLGLVWRVWKKDFFVQLNITVAKLTDALLHEKSSNNLEGKKQIFSSVYFQ